MKTGLLLLLIIFFSSAVFSQNQDYYNKAHLRYDDYVYVENIASVQLLKYNLAQGYDFPSIQLGSNEKLMLTFDDLNSGTGGYMYTMVLCNADWTPSQLMPMEYIEGLTEIFFNQSRYSFNTTMKYSHYEVLLPADNIKPTKAGNYLLIVYPEGEPEKPVLTRRMFVYQNLVDAKLNVRLATQPERRYTHQELNLVINKSGYFMPDPFSFLTVVIQQNGRKDNMKTLVRPRNIKGDLITYSYLNDIVFPAGNEYRKLDIRSFFRQSARVKKMSFDSSGFQIDMMPDPMRGRENYKFYDDINGRYRIINWDDPHLSSMIESDYGYVHFTMPVNIFNMDGEYYIMGELTNWRLDPKYKMKYNPETGVYETTLLLKQAYYDYMYVFLPNKAKVAQTSDTEGDRSATENEYHVFVYYRDPGEIYDRLINLSFFSSVVGD
jgi:hypothetical protein